VQAGRSLHILQGHTNWVRTVIYSPDGKLLASGGEDQMIRLWDVETGTCLYMLQGHTSWVRSLAFNPDGSLLASGADDQTIRLWEVERGEVTMAPTSGRLRSGSRARASGKLAGPTPDLSGYPPPAGSRFHRNQAASWPPVRVKWNVAPRFSFASAQTLPPCRWTMRCTSARPTPVPS